MKVVVLFLLMLFTGVSGLILFLGDCESIVRLILSKPLGLLLLAASYFLHGSLRKEYQRILNNNKKYLEL